MGSKAGQKRKHEESGGSSNHKNADEPEAKITKREPKPSAVASVAAGTTSAVLPVNTSQPKNEKEEYDDDAPLGTGMMTGVHIEHDETKCGDADKKGLDMLHHIDPAVAQLPDDEDAEYRIEPIVKPAPAKNPMLPPEGAWVQSTEDILGPDSQHAYVQRWVRMVKEEYSGSVKFRVVRNDGSRENLILLLGLKNVFVKQLPNMPKPYVTRLVFDRKHESMALLKRTERGQYVVMGGCCYRPFYLQKFAEIAFLAISHNEQVRGYGTRLMAHTKEHAKEMGLDFLLTCADNAAVPYFKKQGFSKRITLPKELWQGYIKDYEGVTLMECKLHDKVNYLNIPAYIKAQKMALIERLKEMSCSHIVFPGIDVTKTGGIPVQDIPGLSLLHVDVKREGGKEATGSSTTTPTDQLMASLVKSKATIANRDPAAQAQLQKHLQHVLDLTKSQTFAWPFMEPVNPKETGAYDYYDVIKNPIDLSTIQERLDLGWYYITKEMITADIKRMVDNCMTYNGKGHYITDMAQNLEKFFRSKI
mmetsp:Transcript_6631/g.11975  ORF Transcript_6631/g.11975 Transcript_6631/m.11975 type:complete len:531 (+) Transcript_6631:127-1719(+)